MLTPFDPRQINSEPQATAMVDTRDAYKVLHAHLMTLPGSRERSLALTALEESGMWATKAITHSWTE